jgi:tRNA-dihydrouridine synthase B
LLPEPGYTSCMAAMTMRHLILAPMRGFTDGVFRNAFQRHFRGLDEAVAPFVTSIKGCRVNPSHLRDLAPGHNRLLPVVPQVLSNDPEEFICLANSLYDLGYKEINWNLGCPAPMVARKKRGSGLLPHPDIIDRMLDKVLHGYPGRISIKTRLGRYSVDEMDRLIPVFNRYPLARVIVHPRTGAQMYAASVDLAAFETCVAGLSHPVCYNGDINDLDMFQMLAGRFPSVAGWMLGRGLIANPFLPEMIQGGTRTICCGRARFKNFHDDLLDGYHRRFAGPGHVLDRMKGFWGYFAAGRPDGQQILKRIRKTGSLDHFRQIVAELLDGQE